MVVQWETSVVRFARLSSNISNAGMTSAITVGGILVTWIIAQNAALTEKDVLGTAERREIKHPLTPAAIRSPRGVFFVFKKSISVA